MEYSIIFVTAIINQPTMENSKEHVLKKEIVTTLIKDHLINMQFVNGLNALGWYSLDFPLHSATLFLN
jgi:hypothetical protein